MGIGDIGKFWKNRSSDIIYENIQQNAEDIKIMMERRQKMFPCIIDFGTGQSPRYLKIINMGLPESNVEFIVINPFALKHLSVMMGNKKEVYKTIYGFRISAEPQAPHYARKWQTHPHPWVEYTEEDAAWSRPIGYGRYVDDHNCYLAFAVRRINISNLHFFLKDTYENSFIEREWRYTI